MYKPAGVLSQFVFNHRKRRNRTLLGDVMKNAGVSIPDGIMAIGRLDEDSEGLLLLTTDGQLSKQVREKTVEKEYWVQVYGQVTENTICKLCNGVEISLPVTEDHGEGNIRTYHTLPCKAQILETEVVEVAKPTDIFGQSERSKTTKKFKGICNTCSKCGHKSKDCPMRQHRKQTDGDTNGLTTKMSIPRGLLPPNRISHTEESHHGQTSWISITVTEGKNRQVRRMTHAVGHPTLRLVRVRIGSIVLDGMEGGNVKRLVQSEVETFRK